MTSYDELLVEVQEDLLHKQETNDQLSQLEEMIDIVGQIIELLFYRQHYRKEKGCVNLSGLCQQEVVADRGISNPSQLATGGKSSAMEVLPHLKLDEDVEVACNEIWDYELSEKEEIICANNNEKEAVLFSDLEFEGDLESNEELWYSGPPSYDDYVLDFGSVCEKHKSGPTDAVRESSNQFEGYIREVLERSMHYGHADTGKGLYDFCYGNNDEDLGYRSPPIFDREPYVDFSCNNAVMECVGTSYCEDVGRWMKLVDREIHLSNRDLGTTLPLNHLSSFLTWGKVSEAECSQHHSSQLESSWKDERKAEIEICPRLWSDFLWKTAADVVYREFIHQITQHIIQHLWVHTNKLQMSIHLKERRIKNQGKRVQVSGGYG